jgi:hypothetical protein
MTGWQGIDQTAFRRQEWLPLTQNVLFRNSWWLSQSLFEIVPQSACPGGSRITWGIDYSSTSNGGAFTRGDAMPASDTLVGIAAYQTKDWYQAAAKISGIDKAEMAGNGSEVALDLTSKGLESATKNLVQSMATAFAADLVAMVDSSGTFSDAALTRSTYGLASYEDTTGPTLAQWEDMIEALQNTTYGPIPLENLVICMARNQLTNLSRLSSNLAYNSTFAELSTSTNPNEPIDAGRAFRNASFEGIPIVVVPGFANADIVVVDKNNVKIFYHHEIEVVSKDTAEYADLYHVVAGANLVVLDPLRAGKLSNLTA